MQCGVRGSQHLAACEQIEWIALPVSDHAPGPFHPLSEITKGQIAGRVRKVFGKGDEIIADHRGGSIFGRIVGHGIERVKYDLVLIVPRVGQLTKLNRGRLS